MLVNMSIASTTTTCDNVMDVTISKAIFISDFVHFRSVPPCFPCLPINIHQQHGCKNMKNLQLGKEIVIFIQKYIL